MGHPVTRHRDDEARRSPTGDVETHPESASLERLVGGVAHDLDNLSTAIRASVDTLRNAIAEDRVDPRTADATLARIDRAAEQASMLMGALVAFGRAEPRVVPREMNAVLEAGGPFLRRALGSEVDLTLADPTTASARVDVDFGMLVRAMVHLCGRAAARSARIRLSSSGREIALDLSPLGVSNDPVTPSEPDLARARRLLEPAGARLSLSFADGSGGWSGAIRLPAASTAPTREAIRPPPTSSVERRGCALLAEDHEQVRDALRDALVRCGFRVEAVADGDALVDRVLAEPRAYDIFLIDYDLPGRDGASALEALREAGVSTPTLMISGNVDFRPRLDRLENTEFLQKPFGLSDIRAWAGRQLGEPSGEKADVSS